MRVLIALGILLLAVGSVNAEYWFDDFDSYPAEAIDDQEGWSSNNSGVEVVAMGDSQPNALSLPYSASSGTYGRYNDLDVSCGSQILRVSFRLYRNNTGQDVKVELRDSITTRLEITTDTSGGGIMVSGTNTGVAFPTGQYALFTLFYNGNTDEVALDLDGTRILEWQDIGISGFSSIDNIRFYRIGPVTGDVLFDDVSVQTIPVDVQAWWRFEEGEASVAHEETGRFKPDIYFNQTGGAWEPAPEALYTLFNGENGVRNRHARNSTSLNTLDQSQNIDLGANWTVEFIASIPPAKGVCTFLEWTTFYPPESTSGAWIKIGYDLSTKRLFLFLRDDAAGTSGQYELGAGQIKADDQWHHFAITKQGTTLEGYQDYRSLGSRSLTAVADGTYSFDADCTAYVGQSSSNTWATGNGVRMDEVRVSDNVDLPSFIRIDHPRYTSIDVGVTTCDLTFFAPPWEMSVIRSKTNMLSGSWNGSGSYWAPTNYLGEEKTVVLSKPSYGHGFYDIR